MTTFDKLRWAALGAGYGLILTIVCVGSFMIGQRTGDALQEPDIFDGYCYTVIDKNGDAHPSESAPAVGNEGVYYRTPEEWGLVAAPAVMRVDRPCVCEKVGYDVGGEACEGVP